jgi:hypothetical protein
MKPKRDTPGYRKFVQAVREAADVVDLRLRSPFVEYEVDASARLHVYHREPGDVIRMPRVQALRLEEDGFGRIVPAGGQ